MAPSMLVHDLPKPAHCDIGKVVGASIVPAVDANSNLLFLAEGVPGALNVEQTTARLHMRVIGEGGLEANLLSDSASDMVI